MNRPGHHRARHRGYTLVELLVVVLIVVLVSAATLKVAVLDQGGRKVSEGARLLQSMIVGARDAAYRANAPRGIRLLPDPEFAGGTGALAANRMISIQSAPNYSTGRVTIAPGNIPNAAVGTANYNNGQMSITEAVFTYVGTTAIPNDPTSWYWNVRVGDKIRFDASGRYYTIAGPNQVGAYVNNGGSYTPYNVERYVNFGPPGYAFNGTGSAQNNPNPMAGPSSHFPEVMHLVNGQDDDHDGWIDEGFDGIDNDGDGIIDPGYNGIDDNGNGTIDEPAELSYPLTSGDGGEWEPEAFVGAEYNATSFKDQQYTIVRRPVVSESAREVMLPQGAVIDLTTWNAPGANPRATLPERSRLPIDPYSLTVDIMFAPNGQVITAGAGQSAGSLAGGMAAFPTSNMPFYHFWIAEREDVYDPLFGMVSPYAKVQGGNVKVDGQLVPVSNPSYPNQVNLLPMPEGSGYTPPNSANGPFLKGDRRMVTVFVKTGQVLTNSIESFDPTNTSYPYYRPQMGIREEK